MGPAPNVAQSIDSLWLALPLKSLREPNTELLITNQFAILRNVADSSKFSAEQVPSSAVFFAYSARARRWRWYSPQRLDLGGFGEVGCDAWCAGSRRPPTSAVPPSADD